MEQRYCPTTVLFNHHKTTIYNHVFRMTKSAWHAEEIVQEVFMKIWLHRDSLPQVKDIPAWLFILAKNKVFDYIQRQACRDKHYYRYQHSHITHHDDAMLPLECRKLLAAAEMKLSPRQREVYHLKFVKGFDKKRIARVLNITENTAMHHAKNSMAIVKRFVFQQLEISQRKIA